MSRAPPTTVQTLTSTGELDEEGYECICEVDKLPKEAHGREKACTRLLTGRGILLFKLDARYATELHSQSEQEGYVWVAMDHACYHHGGPLAGGDIEELGGQPCVVCPWHRYKISLVTGEGMYIGIDPMQKGPDGKPQQLVKSKGIKQRIHPTKIKDGWFYVKDSAEKMYKNFVSEHLSEAKKEQALVQAAEAFKQAVEGKADVEVSGNKGDSSARAVEAKQKIQYEVASDEYAMDPFGVTTSGGIKLHSGR
eukprot:gb/GECG01008414.1/.p1 GENE.gb/GECG01008414.1/~~gb/GECG01008414.1/.p1  ORF type:complete len:252 (+),score=33.92 gb/GECG01008414.1/:1-756(+)